MKWKNEKRKLKDLIPCDENPRILTDKQRKDIEKSLKKFDLVEVPAINLDNKIIAGHQRIKILNDLYGGDYEIDVRIPDKLLDEKDYKEYLIRSNANVGMWNFDVLNTSWNDIELNDWGIELPNINNKDLIYINKGDEYSDFVDFPTFNKEEPDIKVIIYFSNLDERELFMKEKNLKTTLIKNNNYIIKL